MDRPLLNNPDLFPTSEVIADTLGSAFVVFEDFIDKLNKHFTGIGMEWRYYNDSKAWLCKCGIKKKTVFWLSVWDGFFKVSCFFTDKTIQDISDEVKQNADKNENVGKLIPIIYSISDKKKLDLVFGLIGQKILVL